MSRSRSRCSPRSGCSSKPMSPWLRVNPSPERPFLKDALERAAKSFVGAAISYVFEGVIAGGVHVLGQWMPWWHSVEFGVGAVCASLVFSLWSRHLGRKGTASLTRAVEYELG